MPTSTSTNDQSDPTYLAAAAEQRASAEGSHLAAPVGAAASPTGATPATGTINRPALPEGAREGSMSRSHSAAPAGAVTGVDAEADAAPYGDVETDQREQQRTEESTQTPTGLI